MKRKILVVGLLTCFVTVVSSVSAKYDITRAVDRQITKTQKMELRAQDKASKAMIIGKVTAVGANTITVLSGDTSYIVNILAATEDSYGTILKRRFLGRATFAEFSVNNRVKVMGTWANDAHTTINATRIWNMSISKHKGAFVGTVQSIDSSTIVFDPVKRERHTAYLSPTTKYFNRTQQTITLTDIKVGHKVRIRGTWDRSNKKVIYVVSVVDMSLPPLPTKTQ